MELIQFIGIGCNYRSLVSMAISLAVVANAYIVLVSAKRGGAEKACDLHQHISIVLNLLPRAR